MMRRWSPYHHHAMGLTDYHMVGIVRRTDHLAVGIKLQLRPNNSLPHRLIKTGTKQLGAIHTTFGRTWTVEQDIPDQSTDREDASRLGMTATYSDVTNLVTPGPKTADGLHRSYVAMRPDTEEPHTLFASLTK